ncbi:MAG: hypothetical protein U0793_28645 [Gemmataceae bacterium]
MPACPMCNKPLQELVRKCPTCQADLDLLVDYASFLSGGLQRAENLARSGDLSQAVWAYLEVLDVDPDNPAARRQITQIVRAVRHFDEQSATRCMAQPSANGAADKKALNPLFVRSLFLSLVVCIIFAIGFILGFTLAGGAGPTPDAPKSTPTLGN